MKYIHEHTLTELPYSKELYAYEYTISSVYVTVEEFFLFNF
jgi:hypothetical protein